MCFEANAVNSESVYLGSYKDFDLEKCLEVKLNSFVRDEADLRRPLLVSLVIPTKIDVGKKKRELALDVLKNMLSECGKLILGLCRRDPSL